MSALAEPVEWPPRTVAPPQKSPPWTGPDRRAVSRGRTALFEGLTVFALAFGGFLALGIWLTLDLKVLAYDGAYRLVHAYLAWYGSPPKLAAIGFVWPPLMTLVFMPFALIKPLATSLVAMPMTSALFAAGTLVVLNRLFEHSGVRRLPRYALLLAFAANPMFVHYATNGMSEMLTFFFLSLTIYEFVRWERTGQIGYIALSGTAMSLGIMSRYELAPYAVVLALAVAAVAIRRNYRHQVIESSLLLFAAPVVYAVVTWMLFNWLIVGDPLSFLHTEVLDRFVLEKSRSASQGGAGGAAVKDVVQLARLLLDLYWRLFAPQLLVLAPLVWLSVRRRSVIGITLVLLILLNPLMTAWFVRSSDLSLLQLRFNMRSMPLAVIAIAWMFWLLRGRLARWALIGVSLAALVACIPLSWHTMKTYPYVFADRDFINALDTGKATDSAGLGDSRLMAQYINRHVRGERQVLVDDAQVFLPMLLSRHPEHYYTRIAYGDARWNSVLNQPRGHVAYLLMRRRQGPLPDLVLARYPGAPHGKISFLTPVYAVDNMVLVAVAPPPAPFSRESR